MIEISGNFYDTDSSRSYPVRVALDNPSPEWVATLVKQLHSAGVVHEDQVVLTHTANHRFAYIDQNLAFADRIARVRLCTLGFSDA